MIRITKQADYGIILLLSMAEAPEMLHTTADLAGATKLPLPMAGKILKALTREGLLSSKRGAHGGYRLAKAPAATSVADIVTAMDGPIAVTDCLDEDCGCQHLSVCPTSHHWQLINAAIRGALDGISLADLRLPAPPTIRPSRLFEAPSIALVLESDPNPALGDPVRSRHKR